MIILGKMFFPKQAPWQQRKNLNLLLGALAVGIVVGGLMVIIFLIENHKY